MVYRRIMVPRAIGFAVFLDVFANKRYPYVSYFERCQDWLINGEAKTAEALNSALQGVQRKLAAVTDAASDEYQDIECTVELLQEQLEALSNPSAPVATETQAPEAPQQYSADTSALAVGGEVNLDLSGLHPRESQPMNLSEQQKLAALDSLLSSNPLLGKGMPKK